MLFHECGEDYRTKLGAGLQKFDEELLHNMGRAVDQEEPVLILLHAEKGVHTALGGIVLILLR
jgi:hypothetical protein